MEVIKLPLAVPSLKVPVLLSTKLLVLQSTKLKNDRGSYSRQDARSFIYLYQWSEKIFEAHRRAFMCEIG